VKLDKREEPYIKAKSSPQILDLVYILSYLIFFTEYYQLAYASIFAINVLLSCSTAYTFELNIKEIEEDSEAQSIEEMHDRLDDYFAIIAVSKILASTYRKLLFTAVYSIGSAVSICIIKPYNH